MGNYWENLDTILATYRVGYVNLVRMGAWLEAAHMVELMHSAYPEGAKVKDFLPFATMGRDASSLIRTSHRAESYCIKWLPKIEASMSLFRTKNQKDFSRI